MVPCFYMIVIKEMKYTDKTCCHIQALVSGGAVGSAGG